MELIDLIPEFNLYEEYWKIYTKSDIIPPQYHVSRQLLLRRVSSERDLRFTERFISSVIGAGVTIGKGSVVRDSIIMKGSPDR